jgi:antitoxin MazE
MEAKAEFSGQTMIVHVPVELAQAANIEPATAVDVSVNEGTLVIKKRGYQRKKYSLEELVSQITDENLHEPTDWGPPCGREAW